MLHATVDVLVKLEENMTQRVSYIFGCLLYITKTKKEFLHNPLGSTWTHLDLLVFTWIYLHLLGHTWIYLHLLVFTWIHLDSLGSTWM